MNVSLHGKEALEMSLELQICKKCAHWPELSKWARSQREQQGGALLAVLQDGVSAGQAHLGRLQEAAYSLVLKALPWFLTG